MNVAPGFAGYTDWRIPEVNQDGGAEELETIVDEPCGPAPPCVDPVFETGCTVGCGVTDCSCTLPWNYWSATSNASDPGRATYVSFINGYVGNGTYKKFSHRVRAVRGGS